MLTSVIMSEIHHLPADDVGGAAVGGHGVRSDEAANQIKLISSDEEVNS